MTFGTFWTELMVAGLPEENHRKLCRSILYDLLAATIWFLIRTVLLDGLVVTTETNDEASSARRPLRTRFSIIAVG